MARFDSWLCNCFIYCWKCNLVQFDLHTFLVQQGNAVRLFGIYYSVDHYRRPIRKYLLTVQIQMWGDWRQTCSKSWSSFSQSESSTSFLFLLSSPSSCTSFFVSSFYCQLWLTGIQSFSTTICATSVEHSGNNPCLLSSVGCQFKASLTSSWKFEGATSIPSVLLSLGLNGRPMRNFFKLFFPARSWPISNTRPR